MGSPGVVDTGMGHLSGAIRLVGTVVRSLDGVAARAAANIALGSEKNGRISLPCVKCGRKLRVHVTGKARHEFSCLTQPEN